MMEGNGNLRLTVISCIPTSGWNQSSSTTSTCVEEGMRSRFNRTFCSMTVRCSFVSVMMRWLHSNRAATAIPVVARAKREDGEVDMMKFNSHNKKQKVNFSFSPFRTEEAVLEKRRQGGRKFCNTRGSASSPKSTPHDSPASPVPDPSSKTDAPRNMSR